MPRGVYDRSKARMSRNSGKMRVSKSSQSGTLSTQEAGQGATQEMMATLARYSLLKERMRKCMEHADEPSVSKSVLAAQDQLESTVKQWIAQLSLPQLRSLLLAAVIYDMRVGYPNMSDKETAAIFG